ncbi:MAG: hypothetical protein CFE45_29550 [Burkholderiales bacterium PBB5]|nr:MAG: hypothetical protein CFE45_29550 [Burkholderiales bacterium PBB5]
MQQSLVRAALASVPGQGMDDTFGAFLVGISGPRGANLRGKPIWRPFALLFTLPASLRLKKFRIGPKTACLAMLI